MADRSELQGATADSLHVVQW